MLPSFEFKSAASKSIFNRFPASISVLEIEYDVREGGVKSV